ncbi:MAG: discoidin domain-containing protein, partial [Thermoguttaceae bacterium]
MRFVMSVLLAGAVSAAALAHGDTDAWQAELQRASQSSRGILPEEDAAGAVDGNVTGKFSFHTGQDENPFWQVDLGEVHDLGRVAVYNPHVPERLAGFRLLLSDDGAQWREAYRHDDTPPAGDGEGKPFVVSLEEQRGRFVRIQVPGRIWMHLDEVQVFTPDGQTNLALKKPATQSSASQYSTRSIRIDAEQGRAEGAELARRALDPVLRSLGAAQREFREELDAMLAAETPLDDLRWADLYARAAATCPRIGAVRDGLERFSPRAMRMAVDDMASTFPDRFADAGAHLDRLSDMEVRLPELREALAAGGEGALAEAEAVLEFQREVLLANPLLDFDELLVVRRNLGGGARSAMGRAIGMAANFHSNDAVPPRGWDNEIALISGLRGEPQMTTLYKPDGGRIVADLKLDFDARRLMFASVGQEGNVWRIFEIGVDGEGLVQVTPDEGADISHSDPCYLPDGRIIFASTANYVALPCVFGSAPMVSLYRMDRTTGTIRQLTFEQDSDWNPTVTNSGRVMYQRWEYADLPHSNSRILFHMNPDGTGQMEYYGSNSYFPTSFFFPQPVPGHPTMVAGILTGHHGTARSGRLLLLDPARGRHEAEGVVQEIPGWGEKVEPIVADRIVDGVWPQFLYPMPLGENYYLVAMKWRSDALWGIYLVDVFDNITLVAEVEGAALLQPVPVKPRPGVPVIADKVDLRRDDATVMLADVYHGPGLEGVPRGQVKQLRVISYYWSSRGMGGLLGSIGMDGPWDIKRVLGTVPVEADGSAHF